jgi:hypothetical protein
VVLLPLPFELNLIERLCGERISEMMLLLRTEMNPSQLCFLLFVWIETLVGSSSARLSGANETDLRILTKSGVIM